MCIIISTPSDSLLDVVSPKMLEELKSQLESLAQEVALLKEQQALQTGECGGGLSGQQGAREKGSGRQAGSCAPETSGQHPAGSVGPAS